MSFETEKLGSHMAAAVSGIDLNQLPNVATQASLVNVLRDSLVLCIPNQKLAPLAFRDAMARFGTAILRLRLERTADCAEVNIISSEDRDTLSDGRRIVNGANWHTDDSFIASPARSPCSTAWSCRRAAATRSSPTCTPPTKTFYQRPGGASIR